MSYMQSPQRTSYFPSPSQRVLTLFRQRGQADLEVTVLPVPPIVPISEEHAFSKFLLSEAVHDVSFEVVDSLLFFPGRFLKLETSVAVFAVRVEDDDVFPPRTFLERQFFEVELGRSRFGDFEGTFLILVCGRIRLRRWDTAQD